MKKQKARSKNSKVQGTEDMTLNMLPVSQPQNIQELPLDIINNVLSKLEYKDLLFLGLTTQKNYQIIYEFIKKKYTNIEVNPPLLRPVYEETATDYGITYFQIHQSVNSKKCVHCDVNQKKRKIFFIPMIQTYICSKCMKERDQYTCVVKTQAKKQWYLEDEDLKDLVSFQKKTMGYYMNLYFLVDIQEKAYEKYGGQQKFEDYKEQRVEKYIQRKNKVEENRDLKNERELIVQRYYNQFCYQYVGSENIASIQTIQKYIKTNIPKNEQKKLKVFEQVKEKLDKIEKYSDMQIKQQYELIKQCDLSQQSHRKNLVTKLLGIYALNLREDSRLCKMFIECDPRLHKNIYEIIEIMRRKHFFYQQTLYPQFQRHNDYYSWDHFTEQQCEQQALKQWIINNQQDTSEYPYTIQLEILQYRDN